MKLIVVCAVLLVAFSQASEPRGAAAVGESLLFGFEPPPASRTNGLPGDVQRRLHQYRERARLFRPTIPRPGTLDGPAGSLYLKRVGLQRAVFSLFDRPDSLRLAESFATSIQLLYEWEGFADSPLSEARSADRYLQENAGSPIAAYVQLFAGHRRLCARSGFQGLDPNSEDGRRVAATAQAQLAGARDSGDPLLRSVAEYLLEARSCYQRH